MRILFTIAHFFNPHGQGKHASQRKDPRPRLIALTQSLAALHQLFGKSQSIINVGQRVALPANQAQADNLDIVICTTQGHHLLNHLALPSHFYHNHATQVEPMLLGFECQAILRDSLGKYDYYCFLEDDLILHDPWFFIKLNWFTQQAGNLNLLQPNRYEVATHNLTCKAYIDGDLLPGITAKFQNIHENQQIYGKIMGMPIQFRRSLNPHSGCYFLNANQMEYWANQPYFLDRDTSFISPLESAATLGIMKTFHVYKSVPEQANFLEIQHFGSAFISLIGQKVSLTAL
ncbi:MULTISPECIES: calcium-binding protein [Calothrix]|uniref:Calcium-binding protein n=2 Tax=Calothrix TaxID=1186 RepID=A0ABR8AMK4_9CYAN|nr:MULTISPECIES: calcium-binding protein [Calothrix]MBD2200513.1 calcium-binding protein [Calothrix parietina FACHB-288]MBD2229530.1 calcium-binding protein [Calothrix anomala FACHB-343]